ncbi:EamA family transporter, partial [Escherichia coli]|nr:EamA family transporter [Escherichia coli]
NVTVLSYTTPLFTIMLAALLLREKVRIYRWSAVLTGFIGVFITLSPNLVLDAAAGPAQIDSIAMIGTALALTGALCA